MKKLLAMLLAMVMVFSLAACAQGGTTNGVSATEKTAAPDNNGEKDSSTSTGDSDSIDVGVCLTITGSGAPNGLIMLAGVQEYVDMVNEKQRFTRGYKRYKETSGLMEWKIGHIFHSIFT